MADSAALSTASSSTLPRSLASKRPSPLRAGAPHTRRCRFGSRSLHRLRARARKDDPEDIYGPYPWEHTLDLNTDLDIQWVPEDRVTLFTTDGLIQIGGSLVPRRVRASEVPNLLEQSSTIT